MENKKTTAPNASVGADAGQPSKKDNMDMIAQNDLENNLTDEKMQELIRKMNEMNAPGYLHMVSHNDLLDTPYVGKQAIIDDLLYTGAYILAGAPKIGKSFLVAQLAYHVSTGQPLWGTTPVREMSSIWHWKMMRAAYSAGCSVCSAWRGQAPSTSPPTLK